MEWQDKIIIIHKNDGFLLYGFESEGAHIIPPHFQPRTFAGDGLLWILPYREGVSYKIETGAYRVKRTWQGTLSICFAQGYTKKEYPARPLCDFFGKEVRFDIENGGHFEKAYAHFYWDNLLMQIAERTYLRKKTDIREGYVLSTLNVKSYAGTYPAVDHEFHMKGRFAVGGKAEANLIKRMLLLQLKMMREDKLGLSRNVCAVQPSGKREYDVWRQSQDLKCKAQMFRITANIEFVEGVYNYFRMTKDTDFLNTHIDAIEKNCSYIERFIRKDGLLDSHVYYEDQVIKDGAVAQAHFFAINSFSLMEKLERLLGREERAAHYAAVAKSLAETACKDVPNGFWDPKSKLFVDWIDAKGIAHNHHHLLANQLPVLLGVSSFEQAQSCSRMMRENAEVLTKFPSFVAAKIEDYTRSEIGIGGPYDLCAAGRYWCWDAEYLASQRDGTALARQLVQVAKEAEQDGYQMGERYDMNYVYYNKGADSKKNWHGASRYYEYPNVFLYTLLCKYLGVSYGFDSDLIVAPLISSGTVTLENYGIIYSVGERLTIKNIGDQPLSIRLPLQGDKVLLLPGEQYLSKK